MNNLTSLNTELKLDKELIENSVIHKNVGQEIVITTSDKIRLCLREHQAALKARNDWITPLGVFLTLIASLVAADFKSVLGITADVWKAFFIMGVLISLIWLFRSIYWAIKLWKKGDIEIIIERLKTSSITRQ